MLLTKNMREGMCSYSPPGETRQKATIANTTREPGQNQCKGITYLKYANADLMRMNIYTYIYIESD